MASFFLPGIGINKTVSTSGTSNTTLPPFSMLAKHVSSLQASSRNRKWRESRVLAYARPSLVSDVHHAKYYIIPESLQEKQRSAGAQEKWQKIYLSSSTKCSAE